MRLTVDQILARIADPGVPVRIRTARDVDPLGYAAAMAPVLIEPVTTESSLDSIVIRNVNHGGNPIEGSTVLCSVELEMSALERVEFVLVPLDHAIPGGAFHHVQLRFVFSPHERPRLLGVASGDLGSDDRVDDVVLSWEAWRAPGAGYSVLTGLDPESYDLSLRAYSGPQRFLEDALGDRGWTCYQLQFPGGHFGSIELLKVCLALGDGIARETASRRIEEMPPDASWVALKQLAVPSQRDDAVELPPAELQTYQTLLRSCATMALHSITLTLKRLREQRIDDRVDWDKVPLSDLGGEEPWMTEAATADLRGVARSAVQALKFMRANPASLPSQISDMLDAAGLLARDGKGKVIRQQFSLAKETPYGMLADNLVR
jgi:hypothetical protein